MTDKETDTLISSALNFDPIAEAEAMGSNNLEIGLAFMHDKVKMVKRLMDQTDDVHSNIAFDDYCAVAQRIGFELVYSETFEGSYGPEQFHVYWNPLGFLLRVESFTYGGSGDVSINSANIYYNIRVSAEEKLGFRHHTSSGGWQVWDDDTGEYIWGGDHDVRDALRYHVQQLSAAGSVMPEWHSINFMWLLNYHEPKVDGYDYKSITRAKIEQFPDKLRDMLFKAMETERVFRDERDDHA